MSVGIVDESVMSGVAKTVLSLGRAVESGNSEVSATVASVGSENVTSVTKDDANIELSVGSAVLSVTSEDANAELSVGRDGMAGNEGDVKSLADVASGAAVGTACPAGDVGSAGIELSGRKLRAIPSSVNPGCPGMPCLWMISHHPSAWTRTHANAEKTSRILIIDAKQWEQ